jgi:hypothetical protein
MIISNPCYPHFVYLGYEMNAHMPMGPILHDHLAEHASLAGMSNDSNCHMADPCC